MADPTDSSLTATQRPLELPDVSIPYQEIPAPEGSTIAPPMLEWPKWMEDTPEEGEFLTKADLINNPEYAGAIRRAMIRRRGADYEPGRAPMDRVVEDWISYHRKLDSGNEFSIYNEWNYLNRQDGAGLNLTSSEYDLFGKLGTIGQTGDYKDAFTDYAVSIITSPSTYVGFGVSSMIASAGPKIAAQALRRGLKRIAAQRSAGVITKEQARQKGLELSRKLTKTVAGTRVAGASAGEAIATGGNDALKQLAVDMKVDPSKHFEWASTATAAALGALGGALDTTAMALERPKGLAGAPGSQRRIREKKPIGRDKTRATAALSESLASVQKYLSSEEWQRLVAEGKAFLKADGKLNPKILEAFLFGNEEFGTRGVVDYMYESGYQLGKEGGHENVTASIINFLNEMPEEVKDRYSGTIAEMFRGQGIDGLDTFNSAFAATMSEAGFTQSLASRAGAHWGRRKLSDGLVASETSNQGAGLLKWGQNLWRKALVAYVGTTALNVGGSVVAQVGQTAVDGTLMLSHAVRDIFAAPSEASRGNFAASQMYGRIITDRLRTLFTPIDNKETVKELLQLGLSETRALYDVSAMGTKSAADVGEILKRYGLDSSPRAIQIFVEKAERVTDYAQAAALVKTQDMFFKNWAMVDNLNRISQERFGRSLEDVVQSGDFRELFTSDEIGEAVHRSLKTTFSADYTSRNLQHNQAGIARHAAELSEAVSNMPVVGFVYPFGRFTNNVVANAYQYSPFYAISLMSNNKMATPENIAKMAVGTATIGMMADYLDVHGQDTGFYELRGSDGRIYDFANTYPFSHIMSSARLWNEMKRGEVTPETMREVGRQIGIGQAAADLEFGGIHFISDMMYHGLTQSDPLNEGYSSSDGFSVSTERAAGSGFGAVVAGFSRPFAHANNMAWVFGDPYLMPDRNQAQTFGEAFVKEASRYTDRLVDGLMGLWGGGLYAGPEDYRKEAAQIGLVFDPNPVQTMLTGVPQKGPRTAAQIMLAEAGVPEWKANFYSGVPKYARLVNEIITPNLELAARQILDPNSPKGKRWANMDRQERYNDLMDRQGGLLARLRSDITKKLSNSAHRTYAELAVMHRLTRIKETNPTLWDEVINDVTDPELNAGLIPSTTDIEKMDSNDLLMVDRWIDMMRENNVFK